MKKLTIIASFFVGLLAFTSCADDNGSNPTLKDPQTFKLNNPSYALNNLDLAVMDGRDDSLVFTCSQPEYGYTARVNYQVQISLSPEFVDETETTAANYIMPEDVYTVVRIPVAAATVNKAVVKLKGWENSSDVALDETTTVYVRLIAYLSSRPENLCVSNVVSFKVAPYYVELKPADPEFWFFVGTGAVGNWDNSAGGYGSSVIPLALVADATYSETTGEGEFTYTGYFNADQFKFILNPGAWEPMWGLAEGGMNGTMQYRAPGDADPACWVLPEAGYYTVNFNSASGREGTQVKVTANEAASLKPVFSSMEIVGGFDNWGNDGGVPVVMNQNGCNPHIWYCDLTLDDDTELKFRTDSSWSNNWGGTAFPYGLTAGDNIAVKKGNYKVVFNDLDCCYYFFTVAE